MSEEKPMEEKGHFALVKLQVTEELNSYWHRDRIEDIFSYR